MLQSLPADKKVNHSWREILRSQVRIPLAWGLVYPCSLYYISGPALADPAFKELHIGRIKCIETASSAITGTVGKNRLLKIETIGTEITENEASDTKCYQ